MEKLPNQENPTQGIDSPIELSPEINEPEILIDNDEDRIKKIRTEIISQEPYLTGWPVLEPKDFINDDGEFLDFSNAQTFEELIEKIQEAGFITNHNNQKVPAETIITEIFHNIHHPEQHQGRTITLRHRLRETVRRLSDQYKQTEEFKKLKDIDLRSVRNPNDLYNILKQQDNLIDKDGNLLTANQMIQLIREGRLDTLPQTIKYKVIELNKYINVYRKDKNNQPKNNWLTKIKSFFLRG